jgi:hypothetical protein
MSYLYGDSSPFPLEGDFLETLVELTAAAVGILDVHHQTADARLRMRQLAAVADRDAKWLTELCHGMMERVRGETANAPSNEASRESTQLLEACRAVAVQGRDRIVARRNAVLSELEATLANQRGVVQVILERFLLGWELPNAMWGISWRVNPGPSRSVVSEALVMSPCGLEATFKLDIEEGNQWCRPVRVDELVDDLRVQIPRRSGIRRRMVFRNTQISRFYIVAADWSPDRCALTLQRKPNDGSGGYEIVRTFEELTIQPQEAIGDPTMTAHPTGDEAKAVHDLVNAVDCSLRPLKRQRVLVTEIAVDEKPLGQVKDLVGLARLLIDAVAPYVREVVQRSPVSQELSIKRDLGDRRREEIFVPTGEIAALIASLPPNLRAQFAPFGSPFCRPSSSDDAGQIEEALLALAN